MSLSVKIIIAMVLAAFVGLGIGMWSNHKSASASYSCVAGPNEQCPSDEWMRDYDRMRAMQDSIKDKTDVINGIMTRLRGDIPAGYQWNEQKKRFTRPDVSNATPVPPSK